MKLFRWFKKTAKPLAEPEKAVKRIPHIEIGSLWILKDTKGDPFPSRYAHVGAAAHILDVQAGWVRYSMGPPSTSMFPDNRCEIEQFVYMYELAERKK